MVGKVLSIEQYTLSLYSGCKQNNKGTYVYKQTIKQNLYLMHITPVHAVTYMILFWRFHFTM